TAAMLDGRFDDVLTSASRMVEIVPDDPNFRLSFMGQIGQVGLERGEAAELVPIIEAAQSISPELPALRVALARFSLAAGDTGAAATVIGPLFAGWSELAHEWTWPLLLAQVSEV